MGTEAIWRPPLAVDLSTVPDDLCAEHRRHWREWRDRAHRYDPRAPREFDGGHITDSRTSHEDRRHRWLAAGAEQCALTERICRTGWSIQCTEGHHPPHRCVGCGGRLGRDTGRPAGLSPYFTAGARSDRGTYTCPATDGGPHVPAADGSA